MFVFLNRKVGAYFQMTLDQKNKKTLRHSGENNNSPRGGFEEHRSTDTAQRLDCAVIALFDFLIIHIWTRSCSLCVYCMCSSIHPSALFFFKEPNFSSSVCLRIDYLSAATTHTHTNNIQGAQSARKSISYIYTPSYRLWWNNLLTAPSPFTIKEPIMTRLLNLVNVTQVKLDAFIIGANHTRI